MKIIDLLNKIANDEESDLLTEFEFDKRIWNFKALNNSVFCLDNWLLNQNITITKHKEILEEQKKIPEKLPKWATTREDKEYTKQEEHILVVSQKINEIIDYLKSKGEKNNE